MAKPRKKPLKQSTKQIIRNLLFHPGIEIEDERKRVLTALFLVTGFLYMFSYALTSLAMGDLPGAIAEAIACIVIVAIFFALRFSNNAKWIFRLFLALCLSMFLILAYTSKGAGVRYIWAFTFPLLAYYLAGRIEGSIWNFAMLVGLVLSLYVLPTREGSLLFIGKETGRLFGAYVLVTLLALIYETVRHSFAKRYFVEQKLLTEEKTRLEEAHNEIKRLSLTDALTNAYNRGFLNDRLPFEIRRARRYNHPISIIMLDLDHFKDVNDAHGHHAGDMVLKNIVELCNGCTRSGIDWSARYGGEEFVVVLPETDTAGAMVAAERLRVVIEEYRYSIQGKSYGVTASLGVAGYNNWEAQSDGADAFSLLKNADDRLYTAKNNGRNIVVGP